jgi:hypothetical protein
MDVEWRCRGNTLDGMGPLRIGHGAITDAYDTEHRRNTVNQYTLSTPHCGPGPVLFPRCKGSLFFPSPASGLGLANPPPRPVEFDLTNPVP